MVLPWCMSNHFNLRSFCLATLQTINKFCNENNIQVPSSVKAVTKFAECSQFANRSIEKLLSNFYFSIDTEKDFNLEV